MLDFDAGKLIIVGVIALIFIPPKDLPRVLRQVGQFVGKMRRMAREFQGQFMDAMHEADMADLRKEAHKLADSARVDLGLDEIDHQLHSTGTKAKADVSDDDFGKHEDFDDHRENQAPAAVSEAKRLALEATPSASETANPSHHERPAEPAPSVAHSG